MSVLRATLASASVVLALSCQDTKASYGSCDDPYDFVFFSLELQGAKRNARGDFVGEFELKNVRFEQEVELKGQASDGEFQIDYPQIRMEFMDLTGRWASFAYLPGTFLAPPDRVRVVPGGRARFVTPLPAKDQLELGGYKFRAILSVAPDVCIQSTPFVVMQKRGPIEGFKTEGRSNKAP